MTTDESSGGRSVERDSGPSVVAETAVCFALEGTLVDGDGATTTAVEDALATLAADPDVVVCVVADGEREARRETLRRSGLDEHVDHLVASADAGGPKERGAPYETVKARVDADEYVMIGDDHAADVEAARAAGFVPIRYEETDGPDFFATLSAMW